MKYIKEYIKIQENGVYIVLGITIKDQLKLLHFSHVPFTESDIAKTGPGYLLTYAGMEDTRNETGRRLVITQEDQEVTHTRVETVMQFYEGACVQTVLRMLSANLQSNVVKYAERTRTMRICPLFLTTI